MLRWDTGGGCLGILIIGFISFMAISVLLGCNFNAECWKNIF